MRPEGYSARQAAKVCGIGRATVQRALKDGRLQGKKKNGVWVITPRALEAAGFLPRQTFEQARIASLEANIRSLKEQLVAINAQLADEKARAERWVSADEARRLLSLFSDPRGKAELDKYEDVTRTLVELRPEPTGSAGFAEALFAWKSKENRDWEVQIDKRDGEVRLYYHGESMSFDLTPEQAGEVGRWLLGAAEIGQKIEDES